VADRGDTHYDLRQLNRWFFVSSALLLVSLVWMVIDDWDRPWKDFQEEFQGLELQKAQASAARLETPEYFKQRDELQKKIAAVQEQLDAEESFREAEAELDTARGEQYRTAADAKIAKAEWNWARILLNKAAPDDRKELEENFQEHSRRMEAARIASEEAEAVLKSAQEKLAGITSKRDALETRLKELQRGTAQIDNKITLLAGGIFKTLRDAPMLDFVAPSIKVEKQVLPDLRKNYSFTTVQRVDMCSTCHIAEDKAGFEDAPAPLAAHPRLDLFLSPTSPHPLQEFGCTVCHEGAAETTDFVRAVHTPNSEEEKEAWKEKLQWKHWHLWDWPMYPKRYIEAGCYACHERGGTLEEIQEDAPKLSKGLHLIETYGCYSCHKIEGWRLTRRVGPSLRRISAKISPEFARSWIAEPRHFRPTTRMPQIFHRENSVSKEWDDTAIAAIQAYLWDRSEKAPVPSMPAELRKQADPERGKELFQKSGCAACHNSPFTEPHEYSRFGPDLTGIGTKLNADWIYQWVHDPKAWWPGTKMPDLRLEPQQAADIAVFLAGQKKEDWKPLVVEADPAQLDEQALEFLKRRFSVDEARATLKKWHDEGGQERILREVGKSWISRQGCYSCHEIAGFEKSMPIGTELSDWGNKNLHQLAFELWDERVPGHFEGAVEPSRHAFAELKLSNPRRFDRGLEVLPLDRLRMPDFHFKPDEVEALVTVLLGLKKTGKTILDPAIPHPDGLTRALDRGEFLVRQKNCYGCHKFDMDSIEAVVEKEDGTTATRRYHGLVSLEDEDEEETYFTLWKPDPDLQVEEEAGNIGDIAVIPWEEDVQGDLQPPRVKRGEGGGILAGLTGFYVDGGEVDSDMEAFPLLPPILYREGEKVRAPWVTDFLLAPYRLRPWLDVKMPTFGMTSEEARSLALFFAARAVQEWPSRYARALRLSKNMSLDQLEKASGLKAEHVAAIESGGRFNQNTLDKLIAWGDSQGFHFDPPPAIPFEAVTERSPQYLAGREKAHPGYLAQASKVLGPEGINCFACHIKNGKTPGGDKLSWAPDLTFARERLRPDWIRSWITDAQKFYPGTKMPTALDLLADPKLHKFLDVPPKEMVEAVKDYLMNSDRVPAQAGGVGTD